MSENQVQNPDPPSNEDITVEATVQQNGQDGAEQKKEEKAVSGSNEDVREEKVDSTENISAPQQQETKASKKQKGKKDELLTITAKELKKMNKKIMQLDTVKEQYEKMRKNYEVLRGDRDQYKTNFQDLNKNQQQITTKLQERQEELQKTVKEVEGMKREKENMMKKIEEGKKAQQNQEVLAEKVKQLEMIVDMTTTNAQATKKSEEKWKSESEKFRELLRIQRQANNSLKSQIQKLRSIVSQTFVLKQQLNRLSGEYETLKGEKEQMPIMMDKFQHQEQMIAQLKQTISQIQKKYREAKSLNEKFQKKVNLLMQEKKEGEKKFNQVRLELEETKGEVEALNMELEDQKNSWEVQRKRYTTDIKTLKTELHHEHQKLKITEWELAESKKKEKQPVQIERVDIHKLTKDDLLNYLQEMQMKNQSLKLTLDSVADDIHKKEAIIKEQKESIMALARQLTKDYPNYAQSEGMEYVEKEIIEIGRNKKNDYAQIVEKVMIENLRLKYSVTALGEEYNQKLRKELEK